MVTAAPDPNGTMWGIHNDALGTEPFEDGFISVGWEVPDLRSVGNDRDRIKHLVQKTFPSAKPRAVSAWAGVLWRFAFEIQEGDTVIAPYRGDRTLNFGVVAGPYEFHPEVGRHQHRPRVTWLHNGVARSVFPKEALYEVGTAITLFQVRNHERVFREFLTKPDGTPLMEAVRPEANALAESDDLQQAAEEPNAERIDQHTRDFVARVLLQELSPAEFEEFAADLLRAMGYQARVTRFSQDGGIDVVAHKDPLGIKPPIIKVQCKQSAQTRGRPDVQQLIGTLARNEAGLFITLGSYSADALMLERERQSLRLFSGADVTDLTLTHYDALPSRWRSRMPLRQVLVVDTNPEVG